MDLGGLVTFFDLMVLHDQLPAFNYTDTFDYGLSFEQSLGGVVNTDDDQVVVPVIVGLAPYLRSKRVALRQLQDRFMDGIPAEPVAASDVKQSLAQLEYQWEPSLSVSPIHGDPENADLLDLGPVVPPDRQWLGRYLLGHLLFGTYAQQTGMSHVLSPRRSRHVAAFGLGLNEAKPNDDQQVFSRLRDTVLGAGAGWRYTELPWSPSFLPWIVKTRKPGEGPTELLRRVRGLRDKRSVRHYRTQLRATHGEGLDSQLARAELTAAADGIAEELASNREELAWAHRLVVEILPEAIGTGLGAAGGFVAGGPVGAALGGVSGVAAKELTRPIQNRLWGWIFEQLPFVSATKLLQRATAAEKELGAGLEKDLRQIWQESRRDAA